MPHPVPTVVLMLAAAAGLGPAGGCARTAPSAVGTGAASQESDMTWLRISDDPARIAAARDRARTAERAALDVFYRSLATLSYIDTETDSLIERNLDEVLLRLRGLVAAETVSDEGVGAALVLCQLQEADGRRYLSNVLKSGTAPRRTRLLGGLWHGADDFFPGGRAYRDFLFAEAELPARLLDQLDDPEPAVVTAAVQCCGYAQVSGREVRFLSLLKRPDVPDRDRLHYWLSRGELSEEFLSSVLATEIASERAWDTSALQAFARSPEPGFREPAVGRLREWLRRFPETGEQGYHGDRLGVLEAVSEAAVADDLPWIRALATDEAGLYAGHPLAAWVRLDPAGGRAELLRRLDREKQRGAAVEAATVALKGSQDAEVIEALERVGLQVGERQRLRFQEALAAIGGPRATEARHRLDPSIAADEGSPGSLDEMLAAAESAGLITVEEAERVRRSLSGPEAGPSDGSPVRLFDLLGLAGLAFGFDAETGMLPCRHDELVADFAGSSRGRFRPEALAETWHRRHQEDFEAPYTLQFVHGGRLYEGELRNLGDWYDVERAVEMINRALADAGAPERFVATEGDGQIACFVFADPAVLAPLAARYGLPLTDDPDEARRKGVEYENYVREKLR